MIGLGGCLFFKMFLFSSHLFKNIINSVILQSHARLTSTFSASSSLW